MIRFATAGFARRNRLYLGFTALATAASVLLAGALLPAAADARKGKSNKVKVMTRNIYLGADLTPALEAQTLPEAFTAAGEILNEVDRTNFPARAKPLAREIKRKRPDLIGLQEVAKWREQTPADGPPEFGGTPATKVRYDFLKLLRKQLRRIGAPYAIAGVAREFDQELPADTDGDGSPDKDGRLTMRDVILHRKHTSAVKRLKMAHFENMFEASVGGIPIPVERGWLSVIATVRGKLFKLVNTHLEAFGDPEIREAQARELFRRGGPLRHKGSSPVVLVGDLNSDNDSVKGKDRLAYWALRKFGMVERQSRQHACCYSDIFDPRARFDHTVDHVMTKPRIPLVRSGITGDDRSERIRNLWPSDHGGVWSVLRIRHR